MRPTSTDVPWSVYTYTRLASTGDNFDDVHFYILQIVLLVRNCVSVSGCGLIMNYYYYYYYYYAAFNAPCVGQKDDESQAN